MNRTGCKHGQSCCNIFRFHSIVWYMNMRSDLNYEIFLHKVRIWMTITLCSKFYNFDIFRTSIKRQCLNNDNWVCNWNHINHNWTDRLWLVPWNIWYVSTLLGARKHNINNNRQLNDNSQTEEETKQNKNTNTMEKMNGNTTENDFVKQNR